LAGTACHFTRSRRVFDLISRLAPGTRVKKCPLSTYHGPLLVLNIPLPPSFCILLSPLATITKQQSISHRYVFSVEPSDAEFAVCYSSVHTQSSQGQQPRARRSQCSRCHSSPEQDVATSIQPSLLCVVACESQQSRALVSFAPAEQYPEHRIASSWGTQFASAPAN
jgi:hypothetical protein